MRDAVTANAATAVAVVGLVVLAVVVLGVAGIRLRRGVVVAVVRAAVQLAVLAVILRGVLDVPVATVAVLAVMLSTAAWTAGRRTAALRGSMRAAAVACFTGTVPVLVIVFAAGALPLQARYVVAVAGIVIGGTMTACTLAGRRFIAGVLDRRDQVEGWLALGATPRESVRDVVRTSVTEALLPGMDQTRTTGLVTLPGAFVGALVGGLSPGGAARFQIVVLAGLLAAGAIAATTLLHLLADLPELPAAPDPEPARAAR